MAVEHEADQRPLQPRSSAHVDGEPGSAQLGRALQIENAQRLAQLPVRLGLEVEGGLFAPSLDGDVVGLATAGGNFVASEVGNAGQGVAHLFDQGGGALVQLVQLVFQRAGLVHDGRRVAALFLERAHLLAQFIAARLELLGQGDGLAAALIEGAKSTQQRGGVGPASAQFFFNKFQVSPDKSQVKHRTTILLDGPRLFICGHGFPAQGPHGCELTLGLVHRSLQRMRGCTASVVPEWRSIRIRR